MLKAIPLELKQANMGKLDVLERGNRLEQINNGEKKAYCYRFREENGEIIYIGNTTNIRQRLKDHKRYWFGIGTITVDVMEVPYSERYKIETALIRRYKPIYNNFKALYDNEYANMTEIWIPWGKIHPDNGRLGLLEIFDDNGMEV